MELNDISEPKIGAAIEVHRGPRPALLASASLECPVELETHGLRVEQGKPVAVVHKGVKLTWGFRPDWLVWDGAVVQRKAVDELRPVHEARSPSSLDLTGQRAGPLINFDTKLLKDGVRRPALDAEPPGAPCPPWSLW